MQVKEVVKITEKVIDDLHEYKIMWSNADLEKLIEDGIIIKIPPPDPRFNTIMYRTFDGMVKWFEYPIPDEQLRPFFKGVGNASHSDGYDTMIQRVKMMWEQRNYSTRNKSLLRWKFKRLQELAFKEKILDRKGRPCRECKSTNTISSGSVNYHGGGYHSSTTSQCLDCEHFEVTGARF